MKSISKVVTAATVALIWLSGNVSQGQLPTLFKYLTETANAVVVVDAQAMFNSPIAKRENWPDDRDGRFAAGRTSIPPRAKSLAIAADLDVDVMRASWEVAVAELDAPRLLTSLADQLGGNIDEVHSTPAVRLPDDSFLLQFPDGTIGAMAPGSRQKVSYWVGRQSRGLSPYLREAIVGAGPKAEIIMALDLDHAFAPKEVERDIAEFQSVQKSQLDKAAVAKLIASVKGVTLKIDFRDQTYGRLSFDFAEDTAIVSDIARPLIIDILGSYSVMVDDVADWKPEVKGNQIALAGSLTNDALMQISSLIHLPSRALHHNATAEAAQASAASSGSKQKKSQLELTQQYLASVESLLKILERKKHDMRTMGQFAQWLENYARKMDHLPTLGVDKEMLQYGRYVAQQLHNASFALKGMGIQQAVAEVGAAGSSRIYGGTLGNISHDNWQQGGGIYGGGVAGNYGRRVETNAAYGVARNLGYEGAVKSKVRQGSAAVTTVRFQTRGPVRNLVSASGIW